MGTGAIAYGGCQTGRGYQVAQIFRGKISGVGGVNW